jgi:hypothetical protein
LKTEVFHPVLRLKRVKIDPTAVAVRTDAQMLRVILKDGREIAVPLEWFPRLAEATAEDRADWRLIGNGLGITWEKLDEDIEVQSLLRRE